MHNYSHRLDVRVFYLPMKGYGIYVKNDLLDPKHYKQMGGAVWLYLWLLDRMTSIDENGVGRVLGGRPVKLAEIKQEVGIHPNTYTNYIERLELHGYIKSTRTPYGYTFRVYKAVKMFGNRVNHKKCESIEIHKKCEYKEDNTAIDRTILGKASLPERESPFIGLRKETMSWNRQPDDNEELIIDANGDGSTTSPQKEIREKNQRHKAIKNDLVDWMINRQGRKPERVNRPSQFKALNELIHMKVSPAEIKKIMMECEVDNYFTSQNILPDFHTVVKRVQKRG